jgi:nucleoid DNA-binding protein
MSLFDDLPDRVQSQLRALSESSESGSGGESLSRLAENWVTKRRLFEEQISALHMRRISDEGFTAEGALILLTYSGSLVFLGPADEDGRRSFEYASIRLRTDVPGLVTASGVRLAASPSVDQALVLQDCPVERTSEVFEVAGFDQSLSLAEQARRLREAAIFLTNGFLKANHTLTAETDAPLEHFTMKTVAAYLADRAGLSQTKVRELIDDYLTTIEAGALLGERVPLGRLGKLFLGVRGPQKPRVIRSPASGEEILVEAKPATAVPKFSFSSHLKERAGRVPTERIGDDGLGPEEGS